MKQQLHMEWVLVRVYLVASVLGHGLRLTTASIGMFGGVRLSTISTSTSRVMLFVPGNFLFLNNEIEQIAMQLSGWKKYLRGIKNEN